MRKITIVLAAFCLCALALQVYASEMGASLEQLSAQETQLWENIKNRDYQSFSAGIADPFLDVDVSGIVWDKKQLLEALVNWKMTEYALSDFVLFPLDKDCVVLVYKASATAVVEGRNMPMKALASTTYVHEGGKWIPKFHTETTIDEPDSAK